MKRGQHTALFLLFIAATASVIAWAPEFDENNQVANYNSLTAADVSSMGDSVSDYVADFDKWPSDAQRGLTPDQIGKNLAALKGKESLLDSAAYGQAVGQKTGTTATVDTSQGPVDGREAASADGAGMSFARLPSASFSAGAFSGVGGKVAVSGGSGATVTSRSVCVAGATVLDAGASFADVTDACVRQEGVSFKTAKSIRIDCAGGGSWSAAEGSVAASITDGVFVMDATTGKVQVSSGTAQSFIVTDCDQARYDVRLNGTGAFVEWTNDGIRSGNARVDELLILPQAVPKNDTPAILPVAAAVVKEVIMTPQGPIVLYDPSAGKFGKSAFQLEPSMAYTVTTSRQDADFEIKAGKVKQAVFVRSSVPSIL